MLALTQNQPQRHDPVTAMFTYARSPDFRNGQHHFHPTVAEDHGRLETRRCGVVADPASLKSARDDQTRAPLSPLTRVSRTIVP